MILLLAHILLINLVSAEKGSGRVRKVRYGHRPAELHNDCGGTI